jgi:hypothetical protein
MRLVRVTVAAFTLAVAAVLGTAATAFAGSPHFVGTPTYVVTSSSVTVQAKEAGLGDEPQIHVVLTGTARCVNPGGNDPQAANKTTFAVAADEPVQNGKSDYTLTAALAFQPSCSPPMTAQVTLIQLADETSGITAVPVPG